MSKIRILHAPENAAFAEKIAAALTDGGYAAVLDTGAGAGDLDPRDDAAVVVIWSPQSVESAPIISAARDALARRMLAPVAIGRISPPPSFEHVWPMDLAGWTGKADDPRWNFVLEEIELATRRAEAAPAGEVQNHNDAKIMRARPHAAEKSDEDSAITAPRRPAATAKPRSRGLDASIGMTPLAFVIGGLFGALMLGGAYFMGLFSSLDPATAAMQQDAGRQDGVRAERETTASPQTVDSAPTDRTTPEVVAYLEAAPIPGLVEEDSAENDEDDVTSLEATDEEIGDQAPPERSDGSSIDAVGDESAPQTDLDLPGEEADGAPDVASSSELREADEDGVEVLEAPDVRPQEGAAVEGETGDGGDLALEDEAASGETEEAVPVQPAFTDQSFPADDDDPIAQLAWASTRDEAAANAYLGNYFRECVECPDMAALETGSFLFGAAPGEIASTSAEGPQRQVSVDQPFAIATKEITYDQWEACVNDGGCNGYRPPAPWGRGKQPVVNVSYDDARAYADWLSQKTGASYRLPTEKEWEYAARAGRSSAFAFGDAISPQLANYHGEFPYRGPRGLFRGRTTPAGAFAPNAFGLFDMHGNVWEWTSDCWRPTHDSSEAMCYARVVKGGAWNTGGWRLRAAHRNRLSVEARAQDTGFRVVRDLE